MIKENLELIKNETIEDIQIKINKEMNSDTQFYKSILLRDEISILGYSLDNSYNIHLQIKNITYRKTQYEIINYLNFGDENKITLIRNETMNFKVNYYISSLLRINEHRFILISPSFRDYELFLVVFDINDIAVFIRYYKIPLIFYNFEIYNYLECKNYNGFISLIYTINMGTQERRFILQYFSVLSYINGTDSYLIYLKGRTTLKPILYINESYIENNVFGVEFYGIKIIKLPNNENGVFYISKKKNKTINENDILNPNNFYI